MKAFVFLAVLLASLAAKADIKECSDAVPEELHNPIFLRMHGTVEELEAYGRSINKRFVVGDSVVNGNRLLGVHSLENNQIRNSAYLKYDGDRVARIEVTTRQMGVFRNATLTIDESGRCTVEKGPPKLDGNLPPLNLSPSNIYKNLRRIYFRDGGAR